MTAAPPTLRGALRAAGQDLFYNSWRVVPANVVLGALLIAALVAWAVVGPLATLPLAVLAAAPLAGLFRLGGQATRGRDVNLSDAADPVRESPVAVLGAGLAFTIGAAVLLGDILSAILAPSVVGWAIGTAAAWGLLALVAFGFAWWPLATDPARAGVPHRERARLAGLLVLAYPGRMALLALVLAAILAASTALTAALLTVAPGFVALVACRFVLPAADRLEASLAARDAIDAGAAAIRAGTGATPAGLVTTAPATAPGIATAPGAWTRGRDEVVAADRPLPAPRDR